MDAKETSSDNNQNDSEANNQSTSTTDDAAPVKTANKAFYLNFLNKKLTNLIFTELIFSFFFQKKAESKLNGDATPFIPSESGDSSSVDQSYGTFLLKIPLDSKIWRSISARSPHAPRLNGRTLSNGGGGGGSAGAVSNSIIDTRNPVHPMSQYSKPWNIFPDPCMNRTLTADVSANGLISVRRDDNIL